MCCGIDLPCEPGIACSRPPLPAGSAYPIYVATFDGQMTVNPKALTPVTFRAEARKICWQLLGPPPEKWDEFYANVKEPPPNPYKLKDSNRAVPSPRKSRKSRKNE